MLAVLLWLILSATFETTAEKQDAIDEPTAASEQQPPNDSETSTAETLSPVSQSEAADATGAESEGRSGSHSDTSDADPAETARTVEELLNQARQQHAQGNSKTMFETLLQAYSLTQRYPDDEKLKELAEQLQEQIDTTGRRLDARQPAGLIDSSKKIVEQ